jgi:hypothetical protein
MLSAAGSLSVLGLALAPDLTVTWVDWADISVTPNYDLKNSRPPERE